MMIKKINTFKNLKEVRQKNNLKIDLIYRCLKMLLEIEPKHFSKKK
jgi:hypothetical protein